MERTVRSVPYGFEEEKTTGAPRGTLVFYDTFEDESEAELTKAAELAARRAFAKLVLYPLHEETAKRMYRRSIEPYYRREERLFAWKREQGNGRITVETWEGKRKKYTPIEAALRHLSDIYPAPLFLYMTPETANAFASFSTFEEWIVKLRLVLTEAPDAAHPRLDKFSHRWDVARDT